MFDMKYILTLLFSLTSSILFSQIEYLYGTTNKGGDFEGGTIYRVKPDGTERQILHHFDFNSVSRPSGQLIIDSQGLIYGTSPSGGKYNRGTLYQFDPKTKNIRILHHFDNGAIGYEPLDVLYLGDNNTLIGQCESNLEVFEFDLNSKTIRSIPQIQNTNANRRVHSIFELKGRVFISTYNHLGQCELLEYFDQNDSISSINTIGTIVFNKPISINDSLFYGTSHNPKTSGTFERSFLYSLNVKSNVVGIVAIFNPSLHGFHINNNLIQIDSNTLITSCLEGGINQTGTLVSFDMSNFQLDTLYSFNQYIIGTTPRELVRINSNTLMGTCFSGGTDLNGTIFKFDISTRQTSLQFDIEEAPHGGNPTSFILQLDSNNFYFNTNPRLLSRNSTLLKYNTMQDSLEVIGTYNDSKNGAFPVSNLIQFGNKLIGSASRKAGFFEYNLNTGDYINKSPNNSGLLRLIKIDSLSFLSYARGIIGPSFLYLFDKNANLSSSRGMHDGNYDIHPVGDWLKHSNGNFYACGNNDGKNNGGTLFKYNPAKDSLSVIHHFSDSPIIGNNPIGSLAEDEQGNIIGIARLSSSSNLFRFDLNADTIQLIDSIPATFGRNDYFGFTLFSDSLLIGLTRKGSQNFLYKYDLKSNQYDIIDSTSNTSINTLLSKPIIGSDSNIYYSFYSSGSNSNGEFFKYELATDSAYRFLSFSDSLGGSGYHPLEVLFLEPFTISINENFSQDNNLKLYPNPFSESLTIIAQEKIKELIVFDISGRIVFQQNNSLAKKMQIDFTERPGIYIIEVTTQKGLYRQKAVKN